MNTVIFDAEHLRMALRKAYIDQLEEDGADIWEWDNRGYDGIVILEGELKEAYEVTDAEMAQALGYEDFSDFIHQRLSDQRNHPPSWVKAWTKMMIGES